MGLLDRPLDVSHPDALALLDFLRKTFQTKDEVCALALEAGVDLTVIVVDQPVAMLWQEVARHADGATRLRDQREESRRVGGEQPVVDDPGAPGGGGRVVGRVDEAPVDAGIVHRRAVRSLGGRLQMHHVTGVDRRLLQEA